MNHKIDFLHFSDVARRILLGHVKLLKQNLYQKCFTRIITYFVIMISVICAFVFMIENNHDII